MVKFVRSFTGSGFRVAQDSFKQQKNCGWCYIYLFVLGIIAENMFLTQVPIFAEKYFRNDLFPASPGPYFHPIMKY